MRTTYRWDNLHIEGVVAFRKVSDDLFSCLGGPLLHFLFFDTIEKQEHFMARKVARSKTTLSGIGSSYTNPLQVELIVSPAGACFIGEVSVINVQVSNLSASTKTY